MGKSRLEAFSDGVLAIIITIMVLGLKVPLHANLGSLLPVLPVFMCYILSFIYVGIYWNNHHHMLHATNVVNGAVLWANHGHLVAADTNLIPFHCMVRVPGYDYDRPVPVLDRGGAIHGYRLDVLAPTFWSAQHWGVKLLRVKIYRPVANW